VDIYDACGNEIVKSMLEAKVWGILLKRTKGSSNKEKILFRMSRFPIFIF
jgi:hypothetical protein